MLPDRHCYKCNAVNPSLIYWFPGSERSLRGRMLRTFYFALVVLAALGSASLSAQVPGSTITGHVFCADTNAPARFAKVLLKSAAQDRAVQDWVDRRHQDDTKS